MAFLSNFKGGYQDIWKAIIRPPKDTYTLKELGPPEFYLKDSAYKRKDLKLKNKNGFTLECSYFEPVKRPSKQLPCVIYLHGNSSSRVEALAAAETLLPLNITVFCFDFAGCGYSEGKYISLGWHESEDVQVIIDYLKSLETVSEIGLWGRSMGAVTALLYTAKNPSVVGGLVLDSAFASFRLLIDEIVKKNIKIPKLIVNGVVGLVRKTISAKAKFDINKLAPIEYVEAMQTPALFVAATEDNLIEPHHTRDLFEKYTGKKNLMLVEGDHNSVRPTYLIDSVVSFFHTMLVNNCKIQKEDTGNKPTKRKAWSEYNDKDEEGDNLNFNLFENFNSIVGSNVEDLCASIRAPVEEELMKAIAVSMEVAQKNNQTKAKERVKVRLIRKKPSETMDTSRDKVMFNSGMIDSELEESLQNFLSEGKHD